MEKSRMQQLREFLHDDPSDSFTQYLLALECIKYHEQNEALQLLQQILEDDKTYIAAYYQLGKLLESLTQNTAAKEIYEKGMIEAKNKKDSHTYNELKSAYNSLCGIFEDDEW